MNNMGAGESKPPPPPLRIDDPYPGNKGIDGISISMAEACATCELAVSPGISSSTAKLTRLFGTAGEQECNNLIKAVMDTVAGKMSYGDFKGQFKTGNLMVTKYIDGEPHCQVYGFKDDAQEALLDDIFKWGAAYNAGLLTMVRVRKQAAQGSYSLDTKAIITPSIPFKMAFNGQEIQINQMTIYHPCPIRIDSVQTDAVLSLNDPSDTKNRYIILVPLVLSNNDEPSVKFFNKIVPSASMIKSPNPITGQYNVEDVATGNDWTLTQLFTPKQVENGKFLVENGYFVWEGIPYLERYKIRDDAQVVHTGWRRSGSPGPTYILLEKPLQIGAIDLATLIQSLPVTPPADAIHPIPDKGIVYKQGPPEGCSAAPAASSEDTMFDWFGGTTTAEGFTGIKSDDSCDPFLNNARNPDIGAKQMTPQKFWAGVFYFLTFVFMFLGAYVAMIIVIGEGDQTTRFRTEDFGKVSAVWAKNFKEKLAGIGQSIKNLTSMAMSRGMPSSGAMPGKLGSLGKLGKL